MFKVKVVLDTGTDIATFVNIANTIEEDVFIEDGTGYRANAKSLMGVMYGKGEFRNLYVISNSDKLSSKFFKFMI